MFEDINAGKSEGEPFDVAVLDPDQIPERLVLKQVNPLLKVVMCHDSNTAMTEVSNALL